ncbi:hypothetical protein HK098_008154 [Nowakowskiella sp. JEL0407]|nr:hypothetical protein HK098_008154 [Nowakowskiella sp. JEL0407]
MSLPQYSITDPKIPLETVYPVVEITTDAPHKNDNSETEHMVHFKFIPPKCPLKRIPVDLCAVIDVSGSMGEQASLTNEMSELAVLDVVKHAMRTIIAAMVSEDRLAIVSFTNVAKVEFSMCFMDEKNKSAADKVVEGLKPLNSTNLWAGLSTALEEFKKIPRDDTANRLRTIFLLTDGLPNIEPPRGHIPMLKQKKDQFDEENFPTINTFGFGYTLESQLLNEIAILGNGQYSFIPDASFVGTVFIHAITAIFSTYARDLKVSIEAVKSELNLEKPILAGFPTVREDWGYRFELGSVLYGQSRDVIIPIKISKEAERSKFAIITVAFIDEKGAKWSLSRDVVDRDETNVTERLSQKYRLLVAETLQSIVKNIAKRYSKTNQFSGTAGVQSVPQSVLDDARGQIDILISDIAEAERWRGLSDDFQSPKGRMAQILIDLEGQVMQAFADPEAYKRWGQHYLPSLARTHQLQVCNNFKDPGVQPYIGDYAKNVRLKLDDMFLNLPPPTPSIRKSKSSNRRSGNTVNMMKFHNANNPCFAGWCTVLMGDGSTKTVAEIVKDDAVVVDLKRTMTSKVACVVVTEIMDNIVTLAKIGGLYITPYHPVFVNHEWKFPVDVEGSEVKEYDCPRVYSIVLESCLKGSGSQNTIVIEGIECATLGHGKTGNKVIEHEYLGTKAVLNDLRNVDNGREWNNGLVTLLGVKRNEKGIISGIISKISG